MAASTLLTPLRPSSAVILQSFRAKQNNPSLQVQGSRDVQCRCHSKVVSHFRQEFWGSKVRKGSGLSSGLPKHRSWKLRAEGPDTDGTGKKSSTAVGDKTKDEKSKDAGQGKSPEKQNIDWKNDADVKKYLSNPSIETLLKVEAKRTAQQLQELQLEQAQGNWFMRVFSNFRRNSLTREKERLDKAQETFIALDLNQIKTCFGYDTFFASEVRRFGDGGMFIGNIRKPLQEVKSRLEEKIKQVSGREVDIWFLEETSQDGEKKQLCVVQPKAEVDLQLEAGRLTNVYGYLTALFLGITTAGTVALMSGFFTQPGGSFDTYVSQVLPLFGGFITILGVSEVATRVTAANYGVRLSPSFLIPSSWTGSLGVVNNYESLLPNKKALFDIPAARISSAYLTSAVLALVAFFLDGGSFNGGDNALSPLLACSTVIIRPQFFFSNPLLSFVQYIIGPYSDELGNVLPQAIPGVGVPVDPLAFAGLLGIVVTSVNLLPTGRLEGGRMTQALFGRSLASRLSFFTNLILGFGALSGSVVFLVWAFVATFFRGGEELPAQDEITPVGTERYVFGFALAIVCLLSLFPNSAGTFPSPLYTPPFFRGELL